MMMSFGLLRIGIKSEGFSVSPIPNITIPNKGVTIEVSIQMKLFGRKRATAVTTTTIIVMCEAIHLARV